MASPAELAQRLPDTLPEDFGEWDGESSSVAAPDDSVASQAAHAVREAPKPLEQPVKREVIFSAAADKPRDAGSTKSGPVFLKQQKSASVSAEQLPNRSSLWLESANTTNEAPAGPLARDPRSPQSTQVFLKQQRVSETPTKPSEQSADREELAPVADKLNGARSTAPIFIKQQKSTETPKPTEQSADRESTPPARVFFKQPKLTETPTESADSVEIVNIPELETTEAAEAGASIFQAFRSKVDGLGEQNSARKKWMIIAAATCAVLLLIFVVMSRFNPGKKSMAGQSVPPVQAATSTEQMTDTSKPSPQEPLTQGKPLAGTESQQTTNNQTAYGQEATASPRVASQMMEDQLAAPTRISQDIKKQVAENGPPPEGFGVAGADGLGGSSVNNSVFSGHAQPVVNAASSKPLSVSAGVAIGMLIQKTPPVYPVIAKTAHVSGTVMLQATIAKNGTIKDLHILNGPAMLRQAAFDAVRTWRYKPYLLNNEPTEVETTVNVVFSLGG